MAVALTTDPLHSLPGKVRLSAVPTVGNYVRVFCSDAPPTSQLGKALQQLTSGNRVEVVKGDVVGLLDAELEVGGAYVFVCQEITKNASTHGGGYSGDPNGYQSETVVGETTQTIYIGQKLSCKVGGSAFGSAELLLWVWNDTVRATTVAVHGEATPAIVNSRTEQTTTAVRDATVATKLAALDGTLSTAVVGDLGAVCADMRTKIPLHFNNIGANYHGTAASGHPDDDNDTEIEELPANPATPAGFAKFAEVVARRLRNHMGNWDGTATDNYHTPSGVATPDHENVMAAGAPGNSDMANAIIAIADVHRAYQAHCADATYHDTPDAANRLTQALGLLPDLHQSFLDAQRKLSPTAPATQNPAVTRLVHSAGFREVSPAYSRG